MPGPLARYILAGTAGLAISLGVTVLMYEVGGLSASLSFAVALAVVFGFHFVANALFVFRTTVDRYTFLRYTISALGFRGLDFVLFRIITELIGVYVVAVVLAVVISNALKFLVYRYLVFVGRDKIWY